MTDFDIEKAVSDEEKRLKRQFNGIDKKAKAVVLGLIENAAFMRVQLRILKEDLSENGVTESFKQSESQKPYDRKRPQAELYNSMNTNYQKIIKQLTDLLPKEDKNPAKGNKDDFFESFVDGREDL